MTVSAKDPSQRIAEATWRSGYAADCKSKRNPAEINDIDRESYQDIPGTERASDNHDFASSVASENENPGALAGATGADLGKSDSREDYRTRREFATLLCQVIDACDPQDAVAIMSEALLDLGAGMPIAAFDSLLEEARLWADFATPPELKCYALASVERMLAKDRMAFIAYATKRFAPPKRMKGAVA